jgi:hypothetical protein
MKLVEQLKEAILRRMEADAEVVRLERELAAKVDGRGRYKRIPGAKRKRRAKTTAE